MILLASPAIRTQPQWRGMERKRRTVWANAERNQHVAAAARAFLAGNASALRALGLDVGRGVRVGGRKPRTVAVLVETTAHAEQMRELLPGWRMDDTVPYEYEPADEDVEEGRKLARGRVVTLMYAVRHGLAADVVLRATGARGPLHLTDKQPESGRVLVRVTTGLLVDVDDDFDDRARKDTEARLRDYREQGFPIVRTEEQQGDSER